LKVRKFDLIKASSMAIVLVMTISLLGYYAIPPYVFVNPGHSVYASGIVDHRSVGQGYSNGELQTWYTISVRLFDDDPINGVKSGETLAYIVTEAEWQMVEWGDTVNLKLSSGLKAEIAGFFPSLKPPGWHGLADSASPISIELVADKTTYTLGEEASFCAKIRNAPEEKGWIGPSIPLKLTLLKTFPFWISRNGEKIYSSQKGLELQQIVLQPGQELEFTFDWELVDDYGRAVPEGVYYVRAYFGYFTEDEEITLTSTTMIGIE
jgi:hypothetical protein